MALITPVGANFSYTDLHSPQALSRQTPSRLPIWAWNIAPLDYQKSHTQATSAARCLLSPCLPLTTTPASTASSPGKSLAPLSSRSVRGTRSRKSPCRRFDRYCSLPREWGLSADQLCRLSQNSSSESSRTSQRGLPPPRRHPSPRLPAM